MTVDDKNILWLDLFPFLGYKQKVKLLNIFPKGKDIKASFLSNGKVREILTEAEIKKMSDWLDEEKFERQIQKFSNENIKFVTQSSEFYPNMLREIDTPPLCLYCKGNLQLLNSLCVGVVGSRRATEYGQLVTKQYVKRLVEAGITIVSGMASGVDTMAHKTAIENSGATIAVLGGGFYHIFPAINQELSEIIARDNLLLSEHSPNTEPLSFNFPVRNRIIAGLSRAVLVTEAGKKSGALHTKNYAVEYNRDVFAVPGRINSEMSQGTNAIIKELQASITTDPDDILDALSIHLDKAGKKSAIQLDMTEQTIINFISSEKKTFQEIIDHTKLNASELNLILMKLTMSGVVTKLANNSYILSL